MLFFNSPKRSAHRIDQCSDQWSLTTLSVLKYSKERKILLIWDQNQFSSYAVFSILCIEKVTLYKRTRSLSLEMMNSSFCLYNKHYEN